MTPEEAWRKLEDKWQDQIEIECYDDFIDFIEEHEDLVMQILREA